VGLFDALDRADGQRVAFAQALSNMMEGGKQTARNVRGALADEQFRRDVGQGLQDVGNRSVAAMLGGPVDLAALPFRAVGLGHPAPVGGSEWLGQRMEGAGMVSPERRPVAETLGVLAVPGAMTGAARGISMGVDRAAANYSAGPVAGSHRAQLGAISPEGRTRTMEGLQAGSIDAPYRLGDVTAGQAKALDRVGGIRADSADVMMTPEALEHIITRRMLEDGYSPEEVVRFIEQAMSKRSNVVRDPAKANQQTSLLGEGQRDALTGQRYDALMPLVSNGAQFEVRSVVPRGLGPRKDKSP